MGTDVARVQELGKLMPEDDANDFANENDYDNIYLY